MDSSCKIRRLAQESPYRYHFLTEQLTVMKNFFDLPGLSAEKEE